MASGANMTGMSRDTPGCSRMPRVLFMSRQKCSDGLLPWRSTLKCVAVSSGLVKVRMWVELEFRLAWMVVGAIVEGSRPLPFRTNTWDPNCKSGEVPSITHVATCYTVLSLDTYIFACLLVCFLSLFLFLRLLFFTVSSFSGTSYYCVHVHKYILLVG